MNPTTETRNGMRKLRFFYRRLMEVAWSTLGTAIIVERIPGQPTLYAHDHMDVTTVLNWISADDDDDPLSYLTTCDVYSLSIVRGRAFAKRIAAARAQLLSDIVAHPKAYRIRWRQPDTDWRKPTRQSRPPQYGTVAIKRLPQVAEVFSYLTGANAEFPGPKKLNQAATDVA